MAFRALVFAVFVAGLAPAPQPFVTPAPQALMTPAPLPPPADRQPVVLVYPFDVQTGADPKLGAAVAQIFGQEMAAAGGVQVLAVPQGITRANFLSNARNEGAQFYISGYVTQVGETASVVEQVVSVDSGVILFSQTAQVNTVADVASVSLIARTEILTFLGRTTQNVQTQGGNAPAPTSTNGAAVKISGIENVVDTVFKHRSANATPGPPSAKPPRGVIVAPVTATASVAAGDLAGATHELYYAANRYFNAQMTGATSDPAQSADAICGSNRDNTIAVGTLAVVPRRGDTFTLRMYTCFGAVLDSEIGKGGSIKAAIDSAVAAYVKTHPDND